MARCFSCDQEIGYWGMVCGAFKHRMRNILRKNLPVFDCPHCGVLCQEKALTYYSFIAIFVAGAVTIMIKAGYMDEKKMMDWRFLVSLGVCFFVARFLWWQKVAKLKEPFIFWGN